MCPFLLFQKQYFMSFMTYLEKPKERFSDGGMEFAKNILQI